jgi:HSF-type DNA-binding
MMSGRPTDKNYECSDPFDNVIPNVGHCETNVGASDQCVEPQQQYDVHQTSLSGIIRSHRTDQRVSVNDRAVAERLPNNNNMIQQPHNVVVSSTNPDGRNIYHNDPLARLIQFVLERDEPNILSQQCDAENVNEQNNERLSIPISTNETSFLDHTTMSSCKELYYSSENATTTPIESCSDTNTNITSTIISYPSPPSQTRPKSRRSPTKHIAKKKHWDIIAPTPTVLCHPLYRDYSNLTETDLVGKKAGRIDSFPVILHTILENVDQISLFHDIIHWNDHGRSFTITNMDFFTEKVIPFYFKGQTKASFFYHQMNSYAFLCLTKQVATNENTFYHAMFLRGLRHLAFYIRRQRQQQNHKSSVQVVSYDPTTEPNLSMYPIVNALVATTTMESNLSTLDV